MGRTDDEPGEAAPPSPVARSRPRPAGRLAGRLSAAAARAREAEEAQEKRAAEAREAKEKKEAKKGRKEASAAAEAARRAGRAGAIAVDMTSASFRLSGIAAAGTVTEAGIGSGGMDLERILKTEKGGATDEKSKEVDGEGKEDEAAPRRYLDMYWLDASERNGTMYLYGKVRVPAAAGKNSKKGGEEDFVYQSCCVTIPNNERNLFVLPRLLPPTKKAEDDRDDEEDEEQPPRRHPISKVYAELQSVLQPSCIPRAQGAAWKAKQVTRSYASEDPSVPRGECQYLKVVYDGRYPVPDATVCARGGATFEKIRGASASNLENFLVKRQLMGPGWVRVYDPAPPRGGVVSWCKWECAMAGPKSLRRLDAVS